jgi:hypothetical protein
MPVPMKNIFTDIFKTVLFALLVCGTFNIRVFDFLNIKRRYFHYYLRYRHQFCQLADKPNMAVRFMAYTWRKPPFRDTPIIKPCFSIP